MEQFASGEGHTFVFDPKAFQEEHSDLEIASYELNKDALFSWAKRVTAIRKILAEKALAQQDVEI